MNKDYSIESLGAPTYWKWLSIIALSSAASVAGLAATVSHPNSHPRVFAFCLFWIIAMAVCAVTRDYLMRMDPLRFRLARWERGGRLYQRVGVTAFRWLFLHTPLGWLDPKLKLDFRRAGIEPLLREMNFAEGTHWISGVVTLGVAILFSATGQLKIGGILMLLIIPFHVYPIFLQRWNRGRVLRLARLWDAHANSSANAKSGERPLPRF